MNFYVRRQSHRPSSPYKIILGDLGIENVEWRMENYEKNAGTVPGCLGVLGGIARIRWLTHTGRQVPPSGLKPNSRISTGDPLPKILTRGLPPHPPAPLSPSQSPGGQGGAKRFLSSVVISEKSTALFAKSSKHAERSEPEPIDHRQRFGPLAVSFVSFAPLR